MRRRCWIFCLAVWLVPACLWAAGPGSSAELPDAPTPAAAAVPAATAPTPQATGAIPGGFQRYAPLYARTIFPGEAARRLTVRNKFIYAGRQMVEPINLVPTVFSAGESQYLNTDPRYGTDRMAFGQRFGAALIREDSDRLFTNAVFPSLLHEDPRYYRMGSGTTMTRAWYAIGQVFISRTDAGKTIPNYAGLLGRGVAAGLTQAYYPDTSRGGGVVLRQFGSSLAGLGAFNLLREFVARDVFSHLTIFRHS